MLLNNPFHETNTFLLVSSHEQNTTITKHKIISGIKGIMKIIQK